MSYNNSPEGNAKKGGGKQPKLYALCRLLDAWDADAKALHQAFQSGLNRGPISGFGKLDRELAGAFAPGVHILHGTPGSGKTAFGLQVASSCQCPAMFVSCEMSLLELLRRITARVTGTYLGRLKTGELSPEESGKLARTAVEATPLLGLMDMTEDAADAQYIEDGAKAMMKLDASSKHVLIVIDSLHSWADRISPQSSEYDRLNDALDSLRQLAHRLHAPILCITERNRQSMSAGGLSAGAGTRKIEYSAETVIDLEAAKDRPDEKSGSVDVTLALAKNRHGAPGRTVRLRFHGATQRFEEV